MPAPGGFGQFYVITALINAATGLYNGYKSRKQQEALAQKNRELTEKMEINRQNFQLTLNDKNCEAQRQLSLQNHALRLEEQRNNFENMCMQTEWNHFLNTWPLINMPSVIREEQILSDDTVALRVIFSKSNDAIFEKAVYPRVQQGLREFVELYHNKFNSRNIIFYHNGFNGSLSGGAVESNIHYALKELPVVIIDSNVLLDEICVSFTMWGLGSTEPTHFTVFRIPYQQRTSNGSIVVEYYQALSTKILSYLKFVLGYAYDAYNLIQYDRPPLLPQIAAYEEENGIRGSMLAEGEVRAVIAEKYGEIYDSVIGNSEGAFAKLPGAFFKGTVLYEIRAEYAEAVKGYVSNEQYVQYLNESLESWVELRSSQNVEDFLNDVISGLNPIEKYFNVTDKEYFDKLSELYNGTGAGYLTYVLQVCSMLVSATLEGSCSSITADTVTTPLPRIISADKGDENKQDVFDL